MLPKDANTENLKTVAVVDAPYTTKKFLIAIALALGIAALVVYFWDPEFLPWTGSTKR